MKQGAIILFVVFAVTAAMVPGKKVEGNEVQRVRGQKYAESATQCPKKTPCAWTVYQVRTGKTKMVILNEFCFCAPGTTCRIDEDDKSIASYVHRCKGSQ